MERVQRVCDVKQPMVHMTSDGNRGRGSVEMIKTFEAPIAVKQKRLFRHRDCEDSTLFDGVCSIM